jgi:hypothetical protein
VYLLTFLGLPHNFYFPLSYILFSADVVIAHGLDRTIFSGFYIPFLFFSYVFISTDSSWWGGGGGSSSKELLESKMRRELGGMVLRKIDMVFSQ